MSVKSRFVSWVGILFALLIPLLVIGILIQRPPVSAQASDAVGNNAPGGVPEGGEKNLIPVSVSYSSPDGPTAPCPGGPTIDGILLNECYIENFNVGGDAVSIRVWYTKNPITATRDVDGDIYVLEHWINTDAQAQQVAAWGREAWEQYHVIFNRHPYTTGCGDRINVQMEDGIGWGGIAYWASSGSCRIGIDSPKIRNGGGQWTVYHEFQHYLQYAYDDGCYVFLKANYDSGSAAGDAEFVEGYADLASDAVDSALDTVGYNDAVENYDPTTSMYDKSYGNVFNKYYLEQVGSAWTPADPHHHMDAVRDHYLKCDDQDTLYVLDTLIPTLTGGALSKEKLFLNFFAANWAKDWADPITQPELVYTDDDGNSYGSIDLTQDVNLYNTKSWSGETTPDDWAARYYQVKPQSGCDYVTVDVDGDAGAHLGINLMAADTAGSTSVSRSGWIGENFARTFAGLGVHDRLVAVVNAFNSLGTYDISFTCVNPSLTILEPRQNPRHAMVGDPVSPISFLARFEVTSGGNPVRGLVESSISAEAEGDAVTIIPGSFQEVGEEYWAILLPPTKTVGTTFVDLTICLDGSICDTETDALLYVDPGNTDLAMVFDASGSMDDEDTPGQGKRIVNAKKAGTVMADLLRDGDRVLVMDFSAKNVPFNCGLPGGSGDCELDIIERLVRTDVTVPGTITAAKDAIDLINARDWTPIGAALANAKDKLLAAPTNTNPKHIILLSDGEENVNPLYADVQAELIASGVIIDTIGFSGEAPEALLAQIAADTGGTYRFVPTTGGTAARLSERQINQLMSWGAPLAMIKSLTTEMLPGPLGLDDVYDYLETKGQDAERLFHIVFKNADASSGTWYEWSTYVDDSVNILRLVVAGKQPDKDVTGDWYGYLRRVEVLPPGADPGKGWIPISPPDGSTPASWDVRNSIYDDVVIIPNPDPGPWKIRTLYFFQQTQRGTEEPVTYLADFMMNGSVQSIIRLKGRFLAPIVDNQGMAGDSVPIVATLLDRTGMIPGAIVIGLVEKPGSVDIFFLFDDGAHNDGAAGDGIYGTSYNQTAVGGGYNVTLLAGFEDPLGPGDWIIREWRGTFWIEGPDINDNDDDGMPDPWEERCKLDTSRNDAQEDPDKDGLINIDELLNGTLPCDPDTDNGGEQDGSEVNNGRNPLWPEDDLVPPIAHFSVLPLNSMLRIHWTHPVSYTLMNLYVSTIPGELGELTRIQANGVYTPTGLNNDETYYLTLAGMYGTAEGAYRDPVAVTPKADPDPPSGAILINNGALTTTSKAVVLYISSTDIPLDGAAESANAHMSGPLALKYNEVSGDIEMRLSNDPGFADAEWEPLAFEKPWTLSGSGMQIHHVFAQFRDAARNESYVVFDDIFLEQTLVFLPFVVK